MFGCRGGVGDVGKYGSGVKECLGWVWRLC